LKQLARKCGVKRNGEIMKTKYFQSLVAIMATAGMVLSASTALPQDSSANPAQPVAASAPAPQLAYGVAPILQLAQAKIGDDTIIAYIKNSGNSYGLSADQIIYLKQQGVSSAVITTMLNQPKAGVAAAAPTAAAPQATVSTAGSEPASTATVAPSVTYVQTVPTTTYYYQPYYYPDYYPVYYGYPAVSLSIGGYWGGGYYGGWHGGHGGYGGGWHGGYNGGGHGGFGGGGHGGGHR
jgi:hypothetical protein